MHILPRLLILAVSFAICVLPAWGQSAVEVEHVWSKSQIDSLDGWVWPQYRGLHGDGVAAATAKPPTQWGEQSQNLAWKTPLPGRAWSSPIVWGDRVWLTDADEDGKHQRLVALDRDSGKIVFQQTLFTNESVQPDYHVTNSYASPTPVCDGEIIYCHFGAYGTAAVRMDSSGPNAIIWQRRDLPCNHYRGPGSSPILFENLLIIHFDGYDQQYVVALDRQTGKTVWKTDRDIAFRSDDGDMHKAFATPSIIDVNGSLQLISPAANAIESYDPRTGRRLWFVTYEEHSSATRPLYDGKTLFISTGFSKAKMMAIDPNGRGDISNSNVRWIASKAIGSKPSAIVHNDRIYIVEDRGVLSCLNASDGSTQWQKRLGGDFSASLILANEHIYAFDETGKSYTIATGDTANVVSENKLDAGCMASPVAVNDCLIVRTTQAVYCFKN
jgi:outer membrane protein assembly factor BamB